MTLIRQRVYAFTGSMAEAATDKQLSRLHVMSQQDLWRIRPPAVNCGHLIVEVCRCSVVARRTPEIGVRMALGATPRNVLGLVVRQGMGLAAAGTVIGIFAAFLLARGLQSLLFGVGAADPLSYAGAAAVMAMSVVLACALPAWRAARVDPTVALRRDG